MAKIFIMLSLCSLTAFANVQPGLEQLIGVSVDDRGISFQVNSNGCTFERDFDFSVEERLEELGPNLPAFEHHFYISVKRVRPDVCEVSMPYGTKVVKSFEELGIHFGKFHITNPIGGEK